MAQALETLAVDLPLGATCAFFIHGRHNEGLPFFNWFSCFNGQVKDFAYIQVSVLKILLVKNRKKNPERRVAKIYHVDS